MDVLVNNAGIANAAPIEHFTLAKWNAVIAVNLTGVFLGLPGGGAGDEGAGQRLDHQHLVGRGMRGSPGLHGYTASKFGVRGLTQVARPSNSGRDGIRVNSVHPGLILTDMTTRIDPDAPATSRSVGRARPADVAGTVVFLASDASAFTSGAEFVVDGGMRRASRTAELRAHRRRRRGVLHATYRPVGFWYIRPHRHEEVPMSAQHDARPHGGRAASRRSAA